MSGFDCFNKKQKFFGLSGQGGYWLRDPLRNIETYDYNYQDFDKDIPFPQKPIVHPTNDLAKTSPQAVSAHYHAQLVFDFYNDVLKRNGIDDKGMKLISVVNVYSSTDNDHASPEWGNAVWWGGKMWYGQENGESFAKYLDIIAHELTHGVTEKSSNLVYRDLPGALNESFSDIFGVIIANWYPGEPNSITTWEWEIGPGLGDNGKPIRNFANPSAAGQPEHMKKYVKIREDDGGVHIYSGIHNKAIYSLLTATDPDGTLTFPTRELALLLYLTLTRLTPISDFGDSRRTLESVARIFYANHHQLSDRLDAIAKAFNAVGIV
jgi:Zn-dependent metalloprotease